MRPILVRAGVALAALALLLSAAARPGAAADPAAQAARVCGGNLRNYSGTEYMYRFRAFRISCRTSKAVAKAFQRCRGNGKARCRHKVYGGYACRERRTYGFASFDSVTTCRKGARTARHTYTDGF